MSQVTNYTVENAGGATVRADINNILLAVQSNNSGVSAPSTTFAGMLWLDTPASGNYTLKIRDKGNNHWLTIGEVDDPGADGMMARKIVASSTAIKRSDGTTVLSEDGSNVATIANVVLGTNVSGFPAVASTVGYVKQVQSLTLDTTDSTTSNVAFSAISGFEKAITIAAGNHVLVLYDLNIGTDSDTARVFIRLVRTSTDIKLGATASSRTRTTTVTGLARRDRFQQVAGSYLDTSPATGLNTYKLHWTNNDSGYTAYLNLGGTDTNSANFGRGASTITLLEIEV